VLDEQVGRLATFIAAASITAITAAITITASAVATSKYPLERRASASRGCTRL
jgi:hypothetical protein